MTKTLPGKAAKKVAKKAAKKLAAKAPHKAAKKVAKEPADEMRRAYEHLCRLRSLRRLLDGNAADGVQLLSRYAKTALDVQQPKEAADLLRAAEHLAFSSLAEGVDGDTIGKELRQVLKAELTHRLKRAAERWDAQESKPARELKELYKDMRQTAKTAWKEGVYSKALESARAADALAHAEPSQFQGSASADTSTELLQL